MLFHCFPQWRRRRFGDLNAASRALVEIQVPQSIVEPADLHPFQEGPVESSFSSGLNSPFAILTSVAVGCIFERHLSFYELGLSVSRTRLRLWTAPELSRCCLPHDK